MGAEASCQGCARVQCVKIEGPPAAAAPAARSAPPGPEGAATPKGTEDSWVPPTCLEEDHIRALLGSLREEERARLECPQFDETCLASFRDLDQDGTGMLEGEELACAVHRALPDGFLSGRLHCEEVGALALAFDEDGDGKIGEREFARFCRWAAAMELHGFFDGTTPVAQVAELRAVPAKRLLLISEFLDPERILGQLVLPDVRPVYYHPDGLTLDEFSAQLASAALIRRRKGHLFESVALANHGPDEDLLWHVCADYPVHLTSTLEAWGPLLPFFHALADMVVPSGFVDLMACNFAATEAGLDCLDMIERETLGKASFSASTDETGNAAQGGDWLLERGGREVAPVYFDEGRLHLFQKCMKPAARVHRSRSRASTTMSRASSEVSRAGSLAAQRTSSALAAAKTALSLADVQERPRRQSKEKPVEPKSSWGGQTTSLDRRRKSGAASRFLRGGEQDPLAGKLP